MVTMQKSLTEIRFEVIVMMVSEDAKLYDLLKEFVEGYEKIKGCQLN
jgi:hypothetical protein